MSAASPAPFPLFMLTPRLVLRHFTLDDLEAAHALYSNPEVMRFSVAGPSTSVRVLLKLGMVWQRQTVWRGKTVDIYAVQRPQS